MPSPFPGIDPYLETYWRDIHTRLMVYAVDAIELQLPDGLIARVEEGVSIDTDEGSRTVSPDVQVVESSRPVVGAGSGVAGVTVVEPVVVPVDEVLTDRHIEIIDPSSGGRVVTAIEVLSPSNKIPHDGREKYIQKQREYLAGGVNLVEIDLIRNGIHTIAVPLGNIPPQSRGACYVCVRRNLHPNEAFVNGFSLRERLPTVRIPLRAADSDISLNLQSLIDTAYDRGRYAGTIDYSVDANPPLSPADARWADELLRAAGTRQ